MKQLNWLGVVLALVAGQAIGMFWYSELFGEQWRAMVKVTPGGSVPVTMTAGAVDNLVVVVGLAWLIAKLGWSGWAGGARAALAAAVFFAVPACVLEPIYAGAPATLMLIEGGYLFFFMVIAGGLIGGLRWPAKAAA